MILKMNGKIVDEDKIAKCMEELNDNTNITELACQGWAMEDDFYHQLFEFITNLF